MEVKRVADREQVEDGSAYIEIVPQPNGVECVLLADFGNEEASYLDGPYLSFAVAEKEGVTLAESSGVHLLYVVTPDA